MNRLNLLLLSLCAAACGGTTTAPTDGGGDATTDGPISQPDGSQPGDAGADGAKLVDAGPAVSDPGNVTCSGASCGVPANYCCDMGDAGQSCVPGTTSSCAGLRRSCDEAADCTGQDVCCVNPSQAMALFYSTTCMPPSYCDPFISPQICKTDAECANNQPCVAQMCNGYLIRSCGPLPAQRCQ